MTSRHVPLATVRGRTNLVVDLDAGRFHLRAAAVCLHQDHVLLQTAAGADFWFLPGGALLLGERSDVALRREWDEEIGGEITIDRLLWVHERTYAHAATTVHEVAFHYLVHLPPASGLLAKEVQVDCLDGSDRVTARWHPLSAVLDLDLRPAFLRSALFDLPDAPQHVRGDNPTERY
jgi:8-oxo-dGTP pyrophosphatase MutT (NUDIX family)